jgi:peptidoglycan/LPS O-acetylase OafA/YrhL
MLKTKTTEPSIPAERVLGWDLLRGMCALAVACYHLMYWQDIATISTLGSYGVYLFFILSGASLAYTYLDKFESQQFSFANFLRVRYLRLAPLYLALMLVALPWKLLKGGSLVDLLVSYLLNATFLFGFFNPSTNATLVGGWSLGIEAIFYLLFPCLMLTFRSTRLAVAVFVALLAIQIGWIAMSLGQSGSYAQNAELYFQAPAFAAYFMGGCLLGVAKRKGLLTVFRFALLGWTVLLGGFAFMVLTNTPIEGSEIIGWRGGALGATCFAMVYAASRLRVTHIKKLASTFGDATYGLYLLHPVLFFGLVQIVFPRAGVTNPTEWTLYARLTFGCLVIALAFGLALLSERYFERPVRQYFKPNRIRQ